MQAVVPRKPRKPSTRPAQGAKLLELRRAAGLSQTELATALSVPQTTIALWERSDKPPRSDVLPQMAAALGVSVEALLGEPAEKVVRARPVGRLQSVVAELRRLPRRQQERIVEVIAALVQQSKSEGLSPKTTRRGA